MGGRDLHTGISRRKFPGAEGADDFLVFLAYYDFIIFFLVI